MTVIAAVPTHEGVFMAADSQLTRGESIMGSVPKIIVKTAGGSDVLIAVTGNHRLSALARHGLKLPDRPDPADVNSCDSWAHAIACALSELAVEAKPPVLDEHGSVDGEALLAFDRHLWLLNGQAAVALEQPFAIGSGAPEARGAMHAVGVGTERHVDPSYALAVAVRAAIDLDPNCGGQVVLTRTFSAEPPKINGGGGPPTRVPS